MIELSSAVFVTARIATAVNAAGDSQGAARVATSTRGFDEAASSAGGTTDTAVTATAAYVIAVTTSAMTRPRGSVWRGSLTSSATLMRSSKPMNA